MTEYRAPRTWHIEHAPSPLGDYLAVNQYGGFEGRHKTAEGARAWIRDEISRYPEDKENAS